MQMQMQLQLQDLKRFEERLDSFCVMSRLSKEDPILWYDLLSNGFVGGGTYMPLEFVWNNRHRPWNWDALKLRYDLATYAHTVRDKSWSYSRVLHEAASATGLAGSATGLAGSATGLAGSATATPPLWW
jgi:hypothetical protein